jgi:phosphoribosylformylglycinamidine synthase
MNPSFLILCGDGINCENETALALEYHGAKVKIMHVNDLLSSPKELFSHHGLIFPGGFSFGDELGSGQILSLKLQTQMSDILKEYLEKPRVILGICNGFQVLIKLGLLPNNQLGNPSADLRPNTQKKFTNRWCELSVTKGHNSLWLPHGIDSLWLPIRHAEGRIVFKDSQKMLQGLKEKNQLPLRYLEDQNGSIDQLAALSDPSGRVLGLMPHPEAACFSPQLPRSLSQTVPSGSYFFKTIVSSLDSV